eukprot:COSAG05_NODE_2174_length_3438_cov_21.754417_2_plen_190_part_00
MTSKRVALAGTQVRGYDAPGLVAPIRHVRGRAVAPPPAHRLHHIAWHRVGAVATALRQPRRVSNGHGSVRYGMVLLGHLPMRRRSRGCRWRRRTSAGRRLRSTADESCPRSPARRGGQCHIYITYHLLGQALYNTSNCSIHQLHLILHYHMLSSSATAPSMHEKYSSIVLSVTLCVAAISESSGVKSRP